MRPRQAGATRGQAQDEQLPAATSHPTPDHSHRLHRRHPDRKVNSIAASLAAPDPDGPHSGIRLPPWVFDGETFTRPGVKDARPWEPVVGDGSDPLPRRTILLAASPKRAPPEVDNVITERR